MNVKRQELIKRIYKSQTSLNYKLAGPFGDRYITYADYIASGQPLKFIEKYIRKVVLPTYANTHTEASFTGLQTSKFREEARQLIKDSVNASAEDVLLFTGSGSTGAIDLLIRKLTQFYNTQPSFPVVFIGPYEHHSNILPWREGPFEVVNIPLCDHGNINQKVLEEQLQKYQGKKPLIGSFSAASNVTGVLTKVEEIHALLKKYDALSFWDYAGAAPYVSIDMNPDNGLPGKDALFISPHKLVGGPGSPGVLVAKKQLFQEEMPVVAGGGTVRFVSKTQQYYTTDIEMREEAGTPAILASIRAGMAFKLKDTVGAEHIQKIEHNFVQKALERFKNHPNIDILGDLEAPRLSFIAFNIRCHGRLLHYNFVVALLNDLFGIQARGGCSCAGPYGHDLLCVTEEKSQQYLAELDTGNNGSRPGWVRINFNYFIPEEEFEYLIKSMIWVSEHGWKLLSAYHFDDAIGLWHCKIGKTVTHNSLSDFITATPEPKKGTSTDKRRKRKSYFKIADELALQTLEGLKPDSLQTYKFPQLDNPVRWYALAQDVLA